MAAASAKSAPSVAVTETKSSIASAAATAVVPLLAFGDSLTSGYYQFGARFRPYADVLQEKIGQQFEIQVAGYPGWTTTDLLDELPSILSTATKAGRPFAAVFILAGTNDLGDEAPSTIVGNLTKIHELSLAHSPTTRTVAIAVPQHGQERRIRMVEGVRKKVNEGLVALVQRIGARSSYFDLATLHPFFDIPADVQARYWDDGLHYTAAGYDRFGELLYEHLKTTPLLAPTSSTSSAATSVASSTAPAPLPSSTGASPAVAPTSSK